MRVLADALPIIRPFSPAGGGTTPVNHLLTGPEHKKAPLRKNRAGLNEYG